MRTLSILLKKDFRELIRTKKFLILLLVLVLFGLMSPLTAYYMPELLKSLGTGIQISFPKPTIFDSYDQLIKNFSGLVTYLLIVIAASELINERKTGQLTTLLNNNVKKSQFVLSKVLVQFLSVLGLYLLSLAAFAFYNAILFDKPLANHALLSFTSLFLYIFFIMALTNFFSSFAPNIAISLVASFALTFLLSLFELFKFGKYLPNHLISLSRTVLEGKDLSIAHQTIGITLLLSLLLIAGSMAFCLNRE